MLLQKSSCTNMGSTEEPDRKRRHLNNNVSSNNNNNNHPPSPPVRKEPVTPSPDDKKVDSTMLQYQNNKLAQQLEVQRNEISVLESKLSQLRSKQVTFDDNLSTINLVWNQVVDELELLTVRASPIANGNHHVSGSTSKEKSISSVPSEQTFLHRLLDRGATESSYTTNSSNGSVDKTGISTRHASTFKCLKHLVQAIDCERVRNDDLAATLRNCLANNGPGRLLAKKDEELRTEAKKLRALMDELHLRHRELLAEVGTCHDFQAKDCAEIRRLTGELEEASLDLETCRRKLTTLRSQDSMLSGPPTPSATPTGKKFEFLDGVVGPEKLSKQARELEAGLEEAKALAVQRLSELQDALQNQLNLTQKIQDIQNKLDDEQYILSSQQYRALDDQVQHLRDEVNQYRDMVGQLQGEQISLLNREKDVTIKAESSDAARWESNISDSRTANLQLKLQQCMSDCDTLQLRVEDANQALEKEESIIEVKKLITTLHREMSALQGQLYEYKEAGSAVYACRAELHSLRHILERKTQDSRVLSEQYAGQVRELNVLQDEIQILRASQNELQLIVDMYNKESNYPREVRDLKQAEWRAQAQIDRLDLELDEHNLELKVKAANEAEALCQQRLTAAEAEIVELKQILDDSQRKELELGEILEAKKEEGDAYMAEIETIGQAYEGMQTQNQRILQQIIECDDYNELLISDSLKAKQLQISLHAEKQELNLRIQHANISADKYKQRIARLEEQARTFIDQLGKATDESRQNSSLLESAKRTAVEAEKELLSTKSTLEAAQKVLEERGNKLVNVQAQLEKERFEKRRAQEELEVVNMKITCLQSNREGGAVVDRLMEEIKSYKTLLKCSVCHERQKEVVITKCYHLFCSPCIQRNLELRHRKCPGCGTTFGQSDVRNVYI